MSQALEKPIHSCLTKAVIADGDALECGPQWALSRRAILRLYDDRIECGNWTVRHQDIRGANLASFRSHILRIPGYVLSLRTDAKTYHFGLNGGRYWASELPFAVTRSESRLRLSWFSVVTRVIAIVGVAYWLWKSFT